MCVQTQSVMLQIHLTASSQEFVSHIKATEGVHHRDQCYFSLRGHRHQQETGLNSRAGVYNNIQY